MLKKTKNNILLKQNKIRLSPPQKKHNNNN